MNSICEVAVRHARMIERQAHYNLELIHKLRAVESAFNDWGRRIILDTEFISRMKAILKNDTEKPVMCNEDNV